MRVRYWHITVIAARLSVGCLFVHVRCHVLVCGLVGDRPFIPVHLHCGAEPPSLGALSTGFPLAGSVDREYCLADFRVLASVVVRH